MATLRGEPVDRPAVSFYELNGLDEDPHDADPFNIYNDPSWAPLIELTREKTDRMVLRQVPFNRASPATAGPAAPTAGPAAPTAHPAAPTAGPAAPTEDSAAHRPLVGVPAHPLAPWMRTETWLDAAGRRFTRGTVRAGDRTLTSLARHDPDVNTVWTVEHLLKGIDDLKAVLQLPLPEPAGEPDVSGVLEAEKRLGDTGIVVIDTPDPLCLAAELFDLATYAVVAFRDATLFHRLLERFAADLRTRTEAVARALPGRLWRVYGPEFASPPHLPPRLFREYVVRYDRPMVESIQRSGGFCRLHSHGNLRAILDDIVSTGCMGLDPIEPPPQGDVELSYVRRNYGRELVLFGNLEIADLESLSAAEIGEKTQRAIAEGTAGAGRGFVLMPSACPCGRKLSTRTLQNYEKIIEVVERL